MASQSPPPPPNLQGQMNQSSKLAVKEPTTHPIHDMQDTIAKLKDYTSLCEAR